VELHNFPSVALKKTDDRSVRLQGGFILGEQTGTGERCNEEREKKRNSISCPLLLLRELPIGQQIMRIEKTTK